MKACMHEAIPTLTEDVREMCTPTFPSRPVGSIQLQDCKQINLSHRRDERGSGEEK